jgi:hypothetical protein
MEVIVDGERGVSPSEGHEDVLSVLVEISDIIRAKKKGILKLEVDGVNIPPSEVAEVLSEKPLQDVQQLQILTGDLAEMLDSALQALEENVPELPNVCRTLAEVFQGENPEEGFDPFQEIARIWGFIKNQEQLAADVMQVDLEELSLGGQPLMEMHRGLNECLEEAIQALEANDCILLGDLLEYELAPRAERETEIVGLLRKHQAASSTSS